jgi:hypothetical protein
MTPALVHIGRQRVAGTLEECAEGRATITRADRTSDHRTISEVSVLSLAAGDPVEARWRDEAVYPATVVAIDGSSLRVRWEDGSEEPISLAAVVSAVEPVGSARPRVPPTCR